MWRAGRTYFVSFPIYTTVAMHPFIHAKICCVGTRANDVVPSNLTEMAVTFIRSMALIHVSKRFHPHESSNRLYTPQLIRLCPCISSYLVVTGWMRSHPSLPYIYNYDGRTHRFRCHFDHGVFHRAREGCVGFHHGCVSPWERLTWQGTRRP
jgi:hypothetical protein